MTATAAPARSVRALKAAFPLTLPVMAGFVFLGTAYGVLMQSLGLGAGWTFLMSAVVFAGAMQYVAITLFTAAFNPLYALAITLMVNARHIFYGLSLLKKMRAAGPFKPLIVFALCDETFSIICTAEAPEGVDRGMFMFFVALLNWCYWVLGSLLGVLVGGLLTLSTQGLDFTLTALFVVIFLNQWAKPGSRPSSLIGVVCSLLCLFLFGPELFIIPAMALMLVVFAISGKKLAGGDV
ncbi:MAG: AzlC family ABC transporter permease [Oscillospiraceae bacterium]|nr:AzlC family ABC transporter permease [Oscillospiraceae bacterium]